MKGLFAVILGTSLLLFLPSGLIAKGPTTKIVIEGAKLQKPIEITDPKVLANFRVWAGPGTSSADRQSLIVDWSQGPIRKAPESLRRYQVSFYTSEAPHELLVYVVYYAFSSGAEPGYVYLPGKSDEWAGLNVRTIFHGVEGNWFHAWETWERVARPLIEKAELSANASCYDESTGRLVGPNKLVTSVLTSPDGLYRAYAESEAVASHLPNAANAECQNTSKLFVSDPKSDNFRPVLVVKPSPEALGNGIDLVDWSPKGNRLLLAQGVWQWGSDAGGIMVRIYDAESKNLSRESLVDEAFGRHVGKNCVGVFYPMGFSSSGQVVLTAGPFFEEGEDKPVEDSCVQQKGFWLVDPLVPTVKQLPDNYRVQRYGKIAP